MPVDPGRALGGLPRTSLVARSLINVLWAVRSVEIARRSCSVVDNYCATSPGPGNTPSPVQLAVP